MFLEVSWWIFIAWYLYQSSKIKIDPNQLGPPKIIGVLFLLSMFIYFISIWTYGLFYIIYDMNLMVLFSTSYDYILQILGVILTGSSMILAILGGISLKTLGGGLWIKEDHKLVETGVFKYIRHPLYSSLIFGCIGFILLFRSLLFLIILFILLPLSYIEAVYEERSLIEIFNGRYLDYMRRTGMFIPRINRKH